MVDKYSFLRYIVIKTYWSRGYFLFNNIMHGTHFANTYAHAFGSFNVVFIFGQPVELRGGRDGLLRGGWDHGPHETFAFSLYNTSKII